MSEKKEIFLIIRDVLSLDNRLVASCHDRRNLDDNVDRHLLVEM